MDEAGGRTHLGSEVEQENPQEKSDRLAIFRSLSAPAARRRLGSPEISMR
jgi:hypothetical protein